MSQPGIETIVRSLEEQGCTVRPTKGGYFIYCPDGQTTIGFHKSKHSDFRAMKNLKAAVRRAGLEWPEKVPA